MSSNSQPISLENFTIAVHELTDDTLSGVRASLETSLSKLKETNDFLARELLLSINEDDRLLYKDTIDENKQVVSSQEKKLEAVNLELRARKLLLNDETLEVGVYL